MAIMQSRIDPNSEAFRANRRDMLALVEGFRALEARVRDTSNQKLPMFQKRGQLTPRQRLAHLLDRGSPFLELSTLAGLNMHDDDGAENIQGGGVIAGIGYCHRACAAIITASNSGIKGGTTAPMGLRKNRCACRRSCSATSCPTSRWWNRAAPTSTTRPRSSSTAAAPSPTWRACRPWASRTSRWCTAPRRPAAPIIRA